MAAIQSGLQRLGRGLRPAAMVIAPAGTAMLGAWQAHRGVLARTCDTGVSTICREPFRPAPAACPARPACDIPASCAVMPSAPAPRLPPRSPLASWPPRPARPAGCSTSSPAGTRAAAGPGAVRVGHDPVMALHRAVVVVRAEMGLRVDVALAVVAVFADAAGHAAIGAGMIEGQGPCPAPGARAVFQWREMQTGTRGPGSRPPSRRPHRCRSSPGCAAPLAAGHHHQPPASPGRSDLRPGPADHAVGPAGANTVATAERSARHRTS